MSITQVARKAGNKRAYRVAYRDHANKQRAETYPSKADAEQRDLDIKQAKSRREPIPRRGRSNNGETFEVFARDTWWPQHVEGARLAAKTQEQYATFLDKHLVPRIGDEPLAYFDVDRVLELRGDLAADQVPDYTSARSLKLLRQILTHAVLTGRLAANPADILRARGQLPPQIRTTDVRPLWPDETEAIRAAMLARQSPYVLRDATLVSLMAYGGLRPEEALALSWGNVGATTIRVERANRNGKLAQTKTGYRRTVPKLIAPLMADLADLRTASPNTSASALVFPAELGKSWTRSGYGPWRARVFKSCAPAGARIYDLRHGYACLLAREGIDIAEGAKRMGHSVAMFAQHYTHVSEEHRDKPNEPMATVVLRARSKSTKSQQSDGRRGQTAS
jgi:integrase